MGRIRVAWTLANVPVVLERDVFLGSWTQPGPGASRGLLPRKVPGSMVLEPGVFLGSRTQPGPGASRWLLLGKVPGLLVFERDVFLGSRTQPGPGASRWPMALESCVLLALQRRPASRLSWLVSVEGLLAEWLKLWLVGAMPRERLVYETEVERLSSVWRVQPAVSVQWSRAVSFGFPERRSAAA